MAPGARLLLLCALLGALLSSPQQAQAAVHFHESFDGLDEGQMAGRFVHSASSKHDGRFELAAGVPDWTTTDKALKMPVGNKRYGITAVLPEPLDPSSGLTLQYEARHGAGYTCGGSYLKLLTHAPGFAPEGLDESTPYTIMFGPDTCGGQGKVHLILRHTNPLNGSVEERHLAEPAKPPQDSFSHVYTLRLTPPSQFTVLVDGAVGAEGDLLDARTFTPPFQPPRTLDDPTDRKPDDWEDEEMVPDPGAVRPPDHDDREYIPDPGAKKPRGWLDDEPATIPNPAARQPPEWDEEEDGEWQPSHIPNPKCKRVGCGAWTPPTIKNLAYSGKWTPPLVKNPKYKGAWSPKQVPNPHYWKEEQPLAGIGKIGAIAVEVWTVDPGYTLDNLVLTSPDDPLPDQLRDAWLTKHTGEVEHKKRSEGAKDKDNKGKKDAAKDKGKKDAAKDKKKDAGKGKPASNPLAKAILTAFRKPPLKAYRPYVRPLLKLLRQNPWMAYPLVFAIPAFTLLLLAMRPKSKPAPRRAGATKQTARRRGLPGGTSDLDDQVPDLLDMNEDGEEEEEEPAQPPTYGMPPPPPKLDDLAGGLEGEEEEEGKAKDVSGGGSGEYEMVGAKDLPGGGSPGG